MLVTPARMPDSKSRRTRAATAAERRSASKRSRSRPRRLDPLPEMRVVEVAAVGVERVDHLEEAALQPGCLGGGVQGGSARVLAGDREVAEDDRRLAPGDLRPGRGAVRTAEVGVDEQLAAPSRGGGPPARPAAPRRWSAQASGPSASKIRLAPGISSGVGDSCTHSTTPSSSIRTSERLAWPVFSI